MKTKIKKLFAGAGIFSILATLIPVTGVAASSKMVYPLQTISKLECRFTDFGELGNNCKQQLPILHSSDYKKYANKDGGYNDYTRLYTVLWGASYKYGWDVGYGGHMGLDIATAKGTPVYAVYEGKVIFSGWKNAFGNLVSIRHTINGKTVVTNYAHLSKLSVKVGDSVSAGKKVGEVGSTGNSTGNHLHFQVDTKTNYSPIYFSRSTCPHSYYEITEKGVCFDELTKITVDPIKFLETNGAILDGNATTKTVSKKTTKKKTKKKKTKKSTKTVTKNIQADKVVKGDIFDRTVYVGYSNGDIRNVQQIYKSLGYYKGAITSNYKDVEESVIRYQLDKGIISDRNQDGAGRFGPKTRATTKKDWDAFVKKGGKIATTYIEASNDDEEDEYITVDDKIKNIEVSNDVRVSAETEKIDRNRMMTVEEREAKEVKDFLKKYHIDLRFENAGGNIAKGGKETLKLVVKDRRGRGFKGTMPGAMTFIANTNMINIFPQKLYYFTDGKRNIELTGLAEGTTTLYVKVGNVTVKEFKINVYNGKKTIQPAAGLMFTPRQAVLGSAEKGLAVLRDSGGKNLINIRYGGTYKLKASAGNGICLKKGTIKTIKQAYLGSCEDRDFRNEIVFDYDDTIAGLIVFDIKAVTNDASYEITKLDTNTNLVANRVTTKNPKGITTQYAYQGEVLDGLRNGITTSGIENGYFLQDRNLTEKDAFAWVRSSLQKMQTIASVHQSKISDNISTVTHLEQKASSRKAVTRGQLLELASKYLVFTTDANDDLQFKDLDSVSNKQANSIFTAQNTWKDKFGTTHFRPNEKVTRGEGAYLILSAMKRNAQEQLVTLK